MIRLFVALELPEDIRTRLAMLCSGVRGARWVAPQNLHLTLRFIGEAPEPALEDIGPALAAVSFDPFDLSISGVGHFESRGRIRTLWAGIEASPALMTLQERIEAALRHAGCRPETRNYKPHITLARLKAARPPVVEGWIAANSLLRIDPLPIDRFTLMESRLGGDGPVYIPLGEFSAFEPAGDG